MSGQNVLLIPEHEDKQGPKKRSKHMVLNA
jgi:hypothetical protein